MKKELLNKRLSQAKIIGRTIARLPFVRCVILNGSLAQGKSKKSSDIDILIIAKDGRIFTARFFINIFALLFGIKRSKDESKGHAGKFCFNYFLTESYLKIPTGRGEKIDKYCAENYSASKFIAGDGGLFEEFLRANEELFEKYNCKQKLSSRHFASPPARWVKQSERSYRKQNRRFLTLFEMTSIISNRLEKLLKSYQIKKIESDPRTKKYPDLIVYNDRELRFHPPKSS
ncbi:MAG: nucleotidyltransferase domain-containing protein [Patescibacteria group bacterium]